MVGDLFYSPPPSPLNIYQRKCIKDWTQFGRKICKNIVVRFNYPFVEDFLADMTSKTLGNISLKKEKQELILITKQQIFGSEADYKYKG